MPLMRTERLSRRRLLHGTTAGGIGIALAACGGGNSSGSAGKTNAGSTAPSAAASRPVRGGTLTLGLMNDIANLDPLLSALVADRRVQYHIYDSLLSTDMDLKLLPGLALSWETADPMAIVFKLRPGVTFHDGTDFNADAVKFNMDRILQTPTSNRRADIASVTSVQAVDPSTVKLVLKSPFSPLLAQLVDRAGMILSPAAIQKLGDGLTRNPLGAGTGPFKFVEYRKDDHVTLTRNETYWAKDAFGGALPYLDKLVFRPIVDETQRLNSLKSGEIDFADEVPAKDVDAIKRDPSLVFSSIAGLSSVVYVLNTVAEPFKDVRVRQALAWSLDRQQIVDTIFFKLYPIANGPVTPPQFPYDASYKPYTRDIAKAKALLAQAGRTSVTVTLLTTAGSPSIQQEAELIKDQVKDAGFTVNIQGLDQPTLVSTQQKHNFQISRSAFSGRLDPDGNTYGQLHTGSGGNGNFGQYANPAMDKALDDARLTFDQAQRVALYRQINKLAAEEAASVYLNYGVTGQYSSTRVKHFTPVPDAVYRFAEVWKQ